MPLIQKYEINFHADINLLVDDPDVSSHLVYNYTPLLPIVLETAEHFYEEELNLLKVISIYTLTYISHIWIRA